MRAMTAHARKNPRFQAIYILSPPVPMDLLLHFGSISEQAVSEGARKTG
jgi:hypothetical protein